MDDGSATGAMQQVLSRRRLVTHHAHGGAQTGARVEPMSIQRPVLGVPVLPLPLGLVACAGHPALEETEGANDFVLL